MATAILLFVSNFGQTFFIAIFAGDIMAYFNLSATQWGAIYGGATMASGFIILWAGGLADLFRVRTLSVVFIGLISLSCIAMALNPSLILLPVIIFLLRFTGQGMLSHIGVVGASRWFVKNRGRALAFTTLGFSFGEATLPILFAFLIGFMAWYKTWYLAAGTAVVLLIILLVLLRKERTPRSESKRESAHGLDGRHWTRAQVLKHGLFWGVLPVVFIPPFLSTALFFQQVHFAQTAGWSHTAFVALFPFYTISSIVFSLFWGAMVDRFGANRLLAIFLLPVVVGFFIFSQFNGVVAFIFGFIFVGAMQGGNATIPMAFWSESYGTEHIGAIRSLAQTTMVMSSAVSPVLTGYLIDRNISFAQQMPFYAVIALGLCVFCWFICRRFFRDANSPLAP